MNIPLPFTGERDVEVQVSTMGLRRWRLAVEIDWLSIGLVRQLDCESSTSPGWRTVSHLFVAWLSPDWSWGDFHTYYDGPHCAWHRGLVKFAMDERWRCAECCPPETP